MCTRVHVSAVELVRRDGCACRMPRATDGLQGACNASSPKRRRDPPHRRLLAGVLWRALLCADTEMKTRRINKSKPTSIEALMYTTVKAAILSGVPHCSLRHRQAMKFNRNYLARPRFSRREFLRYHDGQRLLALSVPKYEGVIIRPTVRDELPHTRK